MLSVAVKRPFLTGAVFLSVLTSEVLMALGGRRRLSGRLRRCCGRELWFLQQSRKRRRKVRRR
jgi:hypothetical protein